MSRDGSIELQWPDENRVYRLRIGELRQLQEKCNKGPMEILHALTAGRWRVDDVIQPIRLGLIGGGMKMEDANRLVELTVHDGALAEACVFAAAIVSAAITGASDEEIELPKGARGKPIPATAGTSSESSTDKAPSSDGPQPKSMN